MDGGRPYPAKVPRTFGGRRLSRKSAIGYSGTVEPYPFRGGVFVGGWTAEIESRSYSVRGTYRINLDQFLYDRGPIAGLRLIEASVRLVLGPCFTGKVRQVTTPHGERDSSVRREGTCGNSGHLVLTTMVSSTCGRSRRVRSLAVEFDVVTVRLDRRQVTSPSRTSTDRSWPPKSMPVPSTACCRQR